MSKPREFWLLKADDDGPMTRPGPDWYVSTTRPNNTEAIHVIEKSAYDEAMIFIAVCRTWFARHGDKGHEGRAFDILCKAKIQITTDYEEGTKDE